MTIRRYVAVALAVWMIWTAFAGLSLRALPPHVVAAGIFGPGNDVSTGTSNAANVVGRFAYYSTTAPGYTVLTTADSYTPADGTNPAFAAKGREGGGPGAPGRVFLARDGREEPIPGKGYLRLKRGDTVVFVGAGGGGYGSAG